MGMTNLLDIRTLVCPDCGHQLDATQGNLVLLAQEARRVHGDRPVRWNIRGVPDNIDLAGPLTADDVRRVVSLSVMVDEGEPWATTSST